MTSPHIDPTEAKWWDRAVAAEAEVDRLRTELESAEQGRDVWRERAEASEAALETECLEVDRLRTRAEPALQLARDTVEAPEPEGRAEPVDISEVDVDELVAAYAPGCGRCGELAEVDRLRTRVAEVERQREVAREGWRGALRELTAAAALLTDSPLRAEVDRLRTNCNEWMQRYQRALGHERAARSVVWVLRKHTIIRLDRALAAESVVAAIRALVAEGSEAEYVAVRALLPPIHQDDQEKP